MVLKWGQSECVCVWVGGGTVRGYQLKQSNLYIVLSAPLDDAVVQQLHEVQLDLKEKRAHKGRGEDTKSGGKRDYLLVWHRKFTK